jgi:hypothetical protein
MNAAAKTTFLIYSLLKKSQVTQRSTSTLEGVVSATQYNCIT